MLRILTISLLLVGLMPRLAPAEPTIMYLELATSINPISKEIVLRTLHQASTLEAELVVIQLNTPGGLDSSTRDIVAALLGSSTPVAVYVAPSGARAASAGTLITMAGHIAAMAPGTNIGAAHPVSLIGGEDSSDPSTSTDKAASDAAAFARSIAEHRGRNVEWAESAVLQSSALSASEALSAGVIDLVAVSLDVLLETLDGWELDGVTLRTHQAVLREIRPSWRERMLGLLADPNLVYVLFILGLYGLIYEFFHPGIGFGLAAGGICLLLALFGLQILPVNVAGVALILFGMGLLALDPFTPTHGILTAGGIVALLAGSLTLFDIPDRSVGLSSATVLAVVGSLALLFVFVFSKGLMIQRKKPVMGKQSLIGADGTVRRDLVPDGTIAIRGEYWNARSTEGSLRTGERVRVIGMEGNTLLVRRSID